MDPTELGSFYSALCCVRCSGRGGGAAAPAAPVVPADPTDPDSPWACLDCGAPYPPGREAEVLGRLEEAMAPPPAQQQQQQEEEEEVSARCERLLHTFSGLVHPNHRLMIDLQSRLAEAYGSGEEGVGPRMEEMTRPMLQRKVQVCHQVRRDRKCFTW